MGQRDALSGDHLGIIGAYAPGTSGFGPKGMHLRWLFPLERGFPNFFRVYRRAAFDPPFSKNILPGTLATTGGFTQAGGTMPFTVQADPLAGLQLISESFLTGSQQPGRYMQLNFSRPVRRVLISLNNGKTVKVHAYSQSGQLLEVEHPAEGKTISLFHEGITRVAIELTFEKIFEITCAETSAMIPDKTWQLVSDKDLFVYNTSHLALPDFSVNLNELANYRNFYNNGSIAYRNKLSSLTNHYKKLLEVLKQRELLPPGSQSAFVDLSKPYHELELLTGTQVSQSGFYPLQWLLWAASDPNIARLLQLYFVDLKAVEGTRYAYKVEAHYSGGTILSGVLDSVEAKAAASNPTRFRFGAIENLGITGMENIPAEPQILTTATVPADRFESRGTARIYINKPVNAADFSDSILLLLTRNAGGTKTVLARKQPIFPSEEALAGIKPVYADYSLAPEVSTSYTANGIDLFGVLQSEVNSGSILVADTQAPPAPRRLNTIQRDGKTFLQAMYGGPEYLAGPDVNGFDLHTASTLNNAISEKFKVLTQGSRNFSTDAAGNRIYVLQCTGLNKLNGLPATGTIRLTHDEMGKTLAPSRRLSFDRYTLSLHSDNTLLVRINTGNPRLELPAQGTLRIEASGDDPAFWGNARMNLAFVPPVGFLLSDAKSYNQPGTNLVLSDAALTCRIVHRRTLTTDMGVDRITGRKLNTQNILELYLDRPLHTAGLFRNGRINDPTSGINILEQFSGPVITAEQITALNKDPLKPPHCTRIWVVSNASAAATAVNAELKFYPFITPISLEAGIPDPGINPQQGMMRLLFSNSANPDVSASRRGGEIFAWATYLRTPAGQTSTPSTTDTIPVSMELLSDVRSMGNGLYEALVMCPKKINKLVSSQKIRFFSMLEYDISSLTGAVVPSNAGKLDTYVALRSRDAKNNAGRMSKAVQLTQIRPAITAAGPMPRMCDTAEGSDNRAPLPDATNHAMVCLQWNNAGTGMRYEVSRASGSAIINQHRALWYLRASRFSLENLFADLPANASVPLVFSVLGTISPGTFRLRLSTNNLNNLVGGRLVQGSNVYQILQAELAKDNPSTCMVLVRCTTQPTATPTTPNILLDREPPYHLIANDSAKLRRLADLNTDLAVQQIMNQAFALLHSTALPTPAFTDRMPASGTDRFFYKVRLVDAAENRGPWSAAGGAVLQWDMRAPEAPTYLRVFPLHREAVFILPASALPGANQAPLRWRLERSASPFLLANYNRIVEISQLQPKTYFTSGRLLVISQPEQLRVSLSSNAEADESTIRSTLQLSRLVSGSGNPVLVAPETYSIGFKVLPVGAGGTRTAQIDQIRFLDPQDGRDRFVIRIGNQTFSEEPAYRCFFDSLPTQNGSYDYRVRALRVLDSTRLIPSEFSAITVNSADLSRQTVTVSRVNTDTGGNTSAQPAAAYTSQLRIQTTAGLTVRVVKTRRSNNQPPVKTQFSASASGANPFSSGEKVTLQPVNGQITLDDLQLNLPTEGYDYQLFIQGLNEVTLLPITL